MSAPPELDEHHRRIRDLVRRALDEDGFVLAIGGALEAVAEHARMRAIDAETFVEMARAAYERAAGGAAPLREEEWESLPDAPPDP